MAGAYGMEMNHYNPEVEQEVDGAWLPAIPEPMRISRYFFLSAYECGCGEVLASEDAYGYHYRTEQLKELKRRYEQDTVAKENAVSVLHEALALATKDLERGCAPQSAATAKLMKKHYIIEARNLSTQKRLALKMDIDPERVDELAEQLRT